VALADVSAPRRLSWSISFRTLPRVSIVVREDDGADLGGVGEDAAPLPGVGVGKVADDLVERPGGWLRELGSVWRRRPVPAQAAEQFREVPHGGSFHRGPLGGGCAGRLGERSSTGDNGAGPGFRGGS
ncbi:MAG: hypothetical protein ACRDU7_05825, partial [Acidimicrobiia bacterium]